MELDLKQEIAAGRTDTFFKKVRLVLLLGWPAIMAQLSTIIMQYIDAAMVGRLGAVPAASIGLVATTTWLFWGIGTASCAGFSVQVAHMVGAGDNDGARGVLRQSILVVTAISIVTALIGFVISPFLPVWLGGSPEVNSGATAYFAIFALSLPVQFVVFLSGAMLRCSGNMLVPGLVNIVICVLDVAFNFLLIFPTHQVEVLDINLTVPGADLGVTGAAIGTSLAELVAGGYMMWYLFCRSGKLSHPWRGVSRRFKLSYKILKNAVGISWPLAMERVVMCGAQILVTAIVAPLGTVAIAANAFGVTAESLCYMPGFGISDASTTLVGQSLGAGHPRLAVSFGRISIGLGMGIMAVLGGVMWWLAPEMMGFFSPDATVVAEGAKVLRLEAWVEPMFGAAIVTYGVFVGAGYTVVPAIINFSSIWGVRLTLSLILAPIYGLWGVWLAMAIELAVRGAAFLVFFSRGRWLTHRRLAEPAVVTEEIPPQDMTYIP